MLVRKSDLNYMRNTYGLTGNLNKFYRCVCNFIKWLSLTITLILIPVFLFAIIYYSFFYVNVYKVIACCISLWCVTDCNSKL